MVGSVLFHAGILAAVGGHVLGLLVPHQWTAWVGIDDEAYHWLAVVAGIASGVAIVLGFAILVFRRLRIPRVRATTLRSDVVLFPLLGTAIVTGLLATSWGSAVDRYEYRHTVSPFFRGIFTLRPDGELMVGAPFLYQAHAVTAFVLLAAWPFTRLVHAWSFPVTYLGHAPILYRSRSGKVAVQRRLASRR